MIQKSEFKQKVFPFLCIIFGNIIYALSIKLFVLPSGIALGGTTGIALIIEYFLHIPISAFVLVFNLAMLCLGYFVLGKAFAVTTILSSICYPLFLEICNRIFGDYALTDDVLLCTVLGGIGIGIALGLVIRSGASTGGMDIPPLILNKFFHIPVSTTLYAMDFIVVVFLAMFKSMDAILYGIIFTFIYTFFLDKTLVMGKSRTEIKIVTRRANEITDAILTQIDRGVTLLHAETGYKHYETEVVMSIVSNREIAKVERLAHSIDPKCFVIISRVTEVRGRGFSSARKYKKRPEDMQ
ncbi:MAG: YitT family protein [Oscillospiraceae bacterium]|nr:YitT family protein [Oscillospiraceae bacterium]